MKMPILGGCCCCDLKVGSKIIGTLSLIFTLVSLIITGFAVVIYAGFKENVRAVFEQLANEEQQSPVEKVKNRLTNDDDYQDIQEQMSPIFKALADYVDLEFATIIGLCIASLTGVIFSCLLIHGLRTSRRSLLLPWIVLDTLWILLLIAVIILSFVFLGFNLVSGGIALLCLIILTVEMYLYLVIISQYQAVGLINMHDEMCMKSV